MHGISHNHHIPEDHTPLSTYNGTYKVENLVMRKLRGCEKGSFIDTSFKCLKAKK